MTPERVANYLFLEMCSYSTAGFDDKDVEQWYSEGLGFYEKIIALTSDNDVESDAVGRTDEGLTEKNDDLYGGDSQI